MKMRATITPSHWVVTLDGKGNQQPTPTVGVPVLRISQTRRGCGRSHAEQGVHCFGEGGGARHRCR